MREIFDSGTSKAPSGAEASSVGRVRENPYSALLAVRFTIGRSKAEARRDLGL